MFESFLLVKLEDPAKGGVVFYEACYIRSVNIKRTLCQV